MGVVQVWWLEMKIDRDGVRVDGSVQVVADTVAMWQFCV